ncbi:MAG: serine hydrolase domain-containing protein [Halioglobus sp.]
MNSKLPRVLTATVVVSGLLLLSGCDLARQGLATVMGLPTDKNVLFWTLEQRDKVFRQMDTFVATHTVEAGTNPIVLDVGTPLDLSWNNADGSWDIEGYMADQRAAGVIILHRGEIRLEQYAMDYSASGRWTSFSVAKSFTSTLVGAAIKDGFIKSIDARLTDYIPELSGSGYEGVTVRQLLTMTSGVRWNEDYEDPESDVALFNLQESIDGADPIVLYMKTLEREAPPGTRWQYNTGETNLIGVLVAEATGMNLAEYLTKKVWQPYGMQNDAAWILNDGGREIGGCCLSATLRDYALFGKFALDQGVVNGGSIVPDGWFAAAGTKQADIGAPGLGYGYQWWTYDEGSFAAQGIFGQGIFVDPGRDLVIASNGNWIVASDTVMKNRRNAFYRAVQAAIDDEI